MTLQAVGNQGRPIIFVDWTGIPDHQLHKRWGTFGIESLFNCRRQKYQVV